ncbi:hypothetical protein [Anaerosacchariphilus polymeriproducens]|uniref:hypothetical protein n=1 Tax=Anaerosacchariphilus polymeriproducens TaxID=1812858 RepID=UPI0012D711E0|nr:hypothetical protein [Anaerosacchariphilus polymeriproducens]
MTGCDSWKDGSLSSADTKFNQYYGDYLKTFQDIYQAEVKKSEKELKRLQKSCV